MKLLNPSTIIDYLVKHLSSSKIWKAPRRSRVTTPSLKSRFKHAYFFKLLILFFCITESTLIFTSELHRSPSPQKELSRRAKEVIRDIKTLGPGGPLLPEETSKIEKELILFEKSENGDEKRRKPKKPPFVRYEDIKHWKKLGDRYAIGLNDKGKKLGIFDLSLPDKRSPEYQKKAVLALIETQGYYLRDLIKVIREVIKERRKEKAAFPIFERDHEKKWEKTDQFLELLGNTHPTKKSSFPTEGWEKIKWKKGFLVSHNKAPQSFTLGDIDFERTVKPSKKAFWNRKWKKLKRLLEKYWGISLERDLLSRLRWQKTENGYELTFLPSTYRDYPSRPRKIVDLVRWRASLGDALARLLVKEVTIQISGVIPHIGPLFKLSLRRWFNFQEEQLKLHRYAFLEFLNATQRGESIDSFEALTKRDVIKAAVHIEANEVNILYKILKLRNARWWKKEVVKEQTRSIQSENYILKRGGSFTKIGNLFAKGTITKRGKETEHLFLMALHPLLRKKPRSCLNYSYPRRKKARRTLIHIGESILELIPIDIPGVSFALNLIYDFLIKKGEDDSKVWESRLISQFRLDNQNGKWNHEMELLYDQKLNPFELSLQEESEFLKKMRSSHNL